MSDNAEQGLAPQDPADRAGIGGGIVPDDQADGYEQAVELVQHPGGQSGEAGDTGSADESGESGESGER